MDGWRGPGRERAFVGFAVAVAAGQNLPAVVPFGAFVDLATPFLVVGAAAVLLLALGGRGLPLGLAVVAAVLYTSGHGIHLAANAIADRRPAGLVAETTHFWDERFGHIWWHLGWIGLLAAVCLAERGASVAPVSSLADRRRILASFLLGGTLFTNTVEGGTWPLGLVAGGLFCAWAWRERRPVLVACALAFALDAALVAVWAAWHGGVPQFSELGLV
jgi:hypothetical protein